jgi:hypothetical protein
MMKFWAWRQRYGKQRDSRVKIKSNLKNQAVWCVQVGMCSQEQEKGVDSVEIYIQDPAQTMQTRPASWQGKLRLPLCMNTPFILLSKGSLFQRQVKRLPTHENFISHPHYCMLLCKN